LPPSSLDDDDSEFTKSQTNLKRRRRTGTSGAQVALSNLIEKVLAKMKTQTYAHPFLKPVPSNAKFAPNYYETIKHPIDLGMVRNRIREFRYTSRQDFLDDIRLMVDNCYTYNHTRNPHLLPMADALYQIAETAFEELEPEISELEKVLNPEEQFDNVENGSKDGTDLKEIDLKDNNSTPRSHDPYQFTGEEEVDVVTM